MKPKKFRDMSLDDLKRLKKSGSMMTYLGMFMIVVFLAIFCIKTTWVHTIDNIDISPILFGFIVSLLGILYTMQIDFEIRIRPLEAKRNEPEYQDFAN
jgi:hypothetical protein